MDAKVNVLGTEYTIKHMTDKECKKLSICDASGIAELYSRELIIKSNIDDGDGRAFDNISEFENKVTRHELIHAFFHESGMDKYGEDEDLVNLLAIQVPKMLKVFQELNIL